MTGDEVDSLMKIVVKPLVWTMCNRSNFLLHDEPEERWLAAGVGKHYRVYLRRGVWFYGLEPNCYAEQSQSFEEAKSFCEKDHRGMVAQRLDLGSISKLVTNWRFINGEVAP